MPRPWKLLDSVPTAEGPLELRQRDERDFMISVGGRVLMSSLVHRSEVAVAELGCAPIRHVERPRVLIGGLGLGFTLRAALDVLPRGARVVVAELNPAVVAWCRGPVAHLTDSAVSDRRVHVQVGDVTDEIRRAATAGPPYDAIVLDLYVGPRDGSKGADRALYGPEILHQTHRALSPEGVYAVWGEAEAPAFERRLLQAGFTAQLVRPRTGGMRQAVYVARKIPPKTPGTRRR
jgi:spermidine synthase